MRRRVDAVLLIGVLAALLFGVIMIYSASVNVALIKFHNEKYFFNKQLVSAAFGLVALTVGSKIDYHAYRRYGGYALIFTVGLLLSVFALSRGEINGAHRWIDFGPLSIQPSEVAKFTLVVYFSAWFAERKELMRDWGGTFLPFLGVLAVIGALMLSQPDLGTFAVMLGASVAVFIMAGAPGSQLAAGFAAATLSGFLLILAPYRRARLTTFLGGGGEDASSGAAYHVKNILIAIGSGGWFGRGFGGSGQKRLFLPEPHTDSIFAVISEELGFVVAALVIGLFVLIFLRGIRIALQAPDRFGRLLATGITSWFATQAFLNLASMVHLIPLTGVPLPFISYGGTNLIVSLGAVGVLLNVSRSAVTAATEPAPARNPPRMRAVRA